MMFIKIAVGCVYVGRYGRLSEIILCVIHELCLVSFLVVGESPSALLWSVFMLYVNRGDDGQVARR